MKLITILGLIAGGSALTVEEGRLFLSPATSIDSIPLCATYHGTLTAATLLTVFHVTPECTVNAVGEFVEFNGWRKDTKLVWAYKSNIESSVFKLQLRQEENRFEAGDMNQNQQMSFSVSTPVEPLLSYLGGELYQLSDKRLAQWTTIDSTFSLTEFVVISSTPLPRPRRCTISTSSLIDPVLSSVSEHDRLRLVQVIEGIKLSPAITTMLSKIELAAIRADVEYLTGENQLNAKSDQKWKTRHSMTEGAIKASHWLLDQFSSYGLKCSLQHHLPHYSPNVICKIPGTHPGDGLVVLGAHYDSRGSFGEITAPGADDDASGTSLLLSIARNLNKYPLSFRSDVVIAAFSGEEQGLLGSSFYAQTLLNEGVDVKLMVQSDMLAYRAPGERYQIGFPDLIGLVEARYLVANLSSLYVPRLVIGLTPACCSDHQSFNARGFASTQVFERNGPISDPMYHNSGDLSGRANYDFEQIRMITRVLFATLLETAGWSQE